MVAEYDGTILIVSHDRDFLDRTVTAILAFEGDGKVSAHAGGFSDYLGRRTAAATRAARGRQEGRREVRWQGGREPSTNPLAIARRS